MPNLKNIVTGFAPVLLLFLTLYPLQHVQAQEAVSFSCSRSQTVSHELSPVNGIARFRSNSCICAETAQIAKALMLQVINTPAAGRAEALAKATQTSRDLIVEEGKTASVTLYCYSADVISALFRNAPDAGDAAGNFDDF